MENGSLRTVESIAECSHWNTFDMHKAIIGIVNTFLMFFLSVRLRHALLYFTFKLMLFLI